MMPSFLWPIGRFFLMIGIIIVNPFHDQTNCRANVIPLSPPLGYLFHSAAGNQKQTNQAQSRRALISPSIDNCASIESLLIMPDWEDAIHRSRPPQIDRSFILAQNMAQADQFQVLYAPTSAYDTS